MRKVARRIILYGKYVWFPFHQTFDDVATALEKYMRNYAAADGEVQKWEYVQQANQSAEAGAC